MYDVKCGKICVSELFLIGWKGGVSFFKLIMLYSDVKLIIVWFLDKNCFFMERCYIELILYDFFLGWFWYRLRDVFFVFCLLFEIEFNEMFVKLLFCWVSLYFEIVFNILMIFFCGLFS